MRAAHLRLLAWGTSLLATGVAVIAWGQSLAWDFSFLSLYMLFPLFGLIAFGLMWSHYVTAALRQYAGLGKEVVQNYFEATSAVVLAAILLHPGLLGYQLWRDGQGLPPGSELNYLPNSKDFYVLLGMFSLFVFLVYEFRRAFDQKVWWKYIQYLSDIAIILVYIHAMNVGSRLQIGWFRAIWLFYGVTLVIALGYMYYCKLTDSRPENNA